jgi:6-hydroxynicotinate 3-monooxygenase
MSKLNRIGVVGAGLGGTATAALLAQAGFDVRLYEQAPAFARIGAGIHVGPNVMKIMRRIGAEAELNDLGSHPDFWHSRSADDGRYLARIPLGRAETNDRFGADYVTVHRGDFHAIMARAAGKDVIKFGKKLIGVSEHGHLVTAEFEDGSQDEVDLLIGADGLNSRIREILLGPEAPIYTGYVGHRAIIPADRLGGRAFEPCVKWWLGDRHVMVYYLSDARDELYYVTGVKAPEWPPGRSSLVSSPAEVRAALHGFHPEVQSLIDASDEVSIWPFYTRNPLPVWHRGRIVMLGDACHPMKPHMAQGAAMAIEDGAILVRCLTELTGDLETRLQTYRALRIDRASRVQQVSHANTWLRENEDPFWVFGYDPYQVELTA